jgi:hypothetical protein
VKIGIKIQSFGDVITNSSSEVFCTIHSDRLNEIVEILIPLFPNKDSEMGPTLHVYEEGWEDSRPCISIDFPYGMEGYEEFYRKGLTAILDQFFGSENYTITYES